MQLIGCLLLLSGSEMARGRRVCMIAGRLRLACIRERIDVRRPQRGI